MTFIIAKIASEQHDIVVSWDLGIDRYFESSSSNFETKLPLPNQLESKTFLTNSRDSFVIFGWKIFIIF